MRGKSFHCISKDSNLQNLKDHQVVPLEEVVEHLEVAEEHQEVSVVEEVVHHAAVLLVVDSDTAIGISIQFRNIITIYRA